MKITVLLKRSFFTVLFFLLLQLAAFPQLNVLSLNGYNVIIRVKPVSVVTTGPDCTYGFNYNVNLDYDIRFDGVNIPASLYTLQGTLACSDGSNFFDLPNSGGTGTVTSVSNVWVGAGTCHTASVGTLGCSLVTIEIEGPGISHRFIPLPLQAPLAVQLIHFSAEAQPGKVRVAWATASEENNDFFTVERSADGSQWTEVKKISGAGTSAVTRRYEWMDETPLPGTSYYRLRQTDADGKTGLSDIRSVKLAALSGIAIYPVPNKGNTINLKGLTTYTNQQLQLLGTGGSILFTTLLSGPSVTLPVVPAGMYIVRITDRVSGETASLRYIQLP